MNFDFSPEAPKIIPKRRDRHPVDGSDLAMRPKEPAPPDAPRKLADIPVKFHCICAGLPEWARPCGGCKWNRKR